MAMPVWAVASAGASFTPSPMTSTLRPRLQVPYGFDLVLGQEAGVDLVAGDADLGGQAGGGA
jgi:hypothetical protein